jgi:hypothetical protein
MGTAVRCLPMHRGQWSTVRNDARKLRLSPQCEQLMYIPASYL